MLQQSREEILRVFAEWTEHYAPSNFDKDSQKNGKLLANYVLDVYGTVSITNLNEAVKALGPALDHLPEAKPKTQVEQAREFEKRERERVSREAADNLAKAKTFDNLNLTAASSKEAKRQEEAQKATEALIARWTVNGRTPGTFDDRKTAEGRAALQALRITSNGTVDWVLTLKVVGAAFHHETVSEIRAAAQRELDRWSNKDENTRRREDESKRGVLGNLPRYI
jgi:hypothetical protein